MGKSFANFRMTVGGEVCFIKCFVSGLLVLYLFKNGCQPLQLRFFRLQVFVLKCLIKK